MLTEADSLKGKKAESVQMSQSSLASALRAENLESDDDNEKLRARLNVQKRTNHWQLCLLVNWCVLFYSFCKTKYQAASLLLTLQTPQSGKLARVMSCRSLKPQKLPYYHN
jgi:hypothetical protein